MPLRRVPRRTCCCSICGLCRRVPLPVLPQSGAFNDAPLRRERQLPQQPVLGDRAGAVKFLLVVLLFRFNSSCIHSVLASTWQHRALLPQNGGIAGIFFKYDLEPVGVHIFETHRPLSQFLISLCGIVGGIFATSGELYWGKGGRAVEMKSVHENDDMAKVQRELN